MNQQVMGFVHKIILTMMAVMGFFSLHAQQALNSSIIGSIKSKEGDNIQGASVMIASTNKGATTDTVGNFIIHDVAAGTYTINVTALGYKTKSRIITHNTGKVTHVNFKLEEDLLEMEEVAITIKNKTEEVREQPFAVNAIDATKLHNTTSDVNQILNKTSGVRVREDGGLGSNFNFSLNGFSGNQVKFFLDGVPMDNFGSSLSLNNIPINMAERIEVYKGVVPIELGSDALGGAVNVVTNQKIKRYADISYSFGSFNTHRAALLTKYTDDSTGLTVMANGFYNYSDNNYKVDVQLFDFSTGKQSPMQTVRRFHDMYRSGAGQVEIGVVNKKYADRLFIGFIGSGNHKDIQQGYNMNQVYGQRFSRSQTFMPTLKYKKENLFVKNLSVSAYSSYNFTKTTVVDTSDRFYDWLGNYTIDVLNPKSGEQSDYKSLSIFNDRNWIGLVNLVYKIGICHSVSFNNTNTSFTRVGTDPVAVVPIPFADPNKLNKNIMGLAYNYTSKNRRFKSTVFGKWFLFKAITYEAEYGSHDKYSSNYNKQGFGTAAGYSILPSLLLKASLENTYRLPEAYEMLGDGQNIRNNPLLRPEQSKNANLGFLLSKKIRKSKLEVEANVFYRNAKDYIRADIYQGGPQGRYTNIPRVDTKGFDLTVRTTFNEHFFIEANGTFQDIVNKAEIENGKKSTVYLDRVPNIPYLFGNVDAGFNIKKFGRSARVLTVAGGCSYVDHFWLYWPSKGDKSTKSQIPTQFTQRASITYSLKNGKYSVTLEGTNLSNAKVYDNFAVQKPGRAVYIKLRYFFQ